MKLKLTVFIFLSAVITSFAQQQPNYLNPNLPLEQRVDDLISRMTLKEKISQMRYDAPAIKRLGIPAYNWWNEGLHGVARDGLATVFPQAIGLASTWNRDLMHSVANAISDEARAKYYNAIKKGERGIYQGLTFWSPNINIFRDPRWGRGMETYGEDPYLTGQMAVQFIQGMQGNDPHYFKVIATAKHYAVHSGPEPLRHTIDLNVSDYDLHETYLPAFKASVEKAGVFSVMCAYNSFRGSACCSNDPLLNKILRKDWGFKGYVVSDCWAIQDIYDTHKQAKDAAEASAKAVDAGTDLNCGVSFAHLDQAVKEGLTTAAAIDTSVKRLFTARFKLGMFDPPSMVPYSKINMSVVDSKAHRELALKAAEESIVLLKNEKNLLPLKKNIKSIAVIGPNADNWTVLLGNYNGLPSHAVTPLEGLREKLGGKTKINYAVGCDLAENMPTLNIIPEKFLFTTKDQKVHGLKGEYFKNFEFKGRPAFTRIDKEINFNWWNGRPRADFRPDDFSVRWTGVLVPPKSGAYVIGGYGFNAFKLYVDDSLMINFVNNHSPRDMYDTLLLTSGRTYNIKIEYYENTRFGMMHLLWSPPEGDLAGEAINAAKRSDAVVMFMGLSPRLEGEEMKVPVKGFAGGDRLTLKLPEVQEDLIKKVCAIGKPVVLVLLNGSALSINWEKKNMAAIVESWYGGEAAGTAIANVLFGDYNPSGRLPVTFYESVNQLPPFTDYDMKGRTYRYFNGPVVYPFGYGLSYATFSIGSPRFDKDKISTNGSAMLSVDVKNTGTVPGEEVVELYVKGRGIKDNGAIKSLKGFHKVFLKPGETKTIDFDITPETLQVYKGGVGFMLFKGVHTLMVGSSSADKDLKEVNLTVD